MVLAKQWSLVLRVSESIGVWLLNVYEGRKRILHGRIATRILENNFSYDSDTWGRDVWKRMSRYEQVCAEFHVWRPKELYRVSFFPLWTYTYYWRRPKFSSRFSIFFGGFTISWRGFKGEYALIQTLSRGKNPKYFVSKRVKKRDLRTSHRGSKV